MDGPIKVAYEEYMPLTEDEIDAFFKDMDADGDGYVSFAELEAKLKRVHEELAPNPQRHHLNHPHRQDPEKGPEADAMHAFLCKIMPGCANRLSKEEFHARVAAWQVPSQKQTGVAEQEKKDSDVVKKWPLSTRVRALWAVYGANAVFLAFVAAFVAGISLWQLLIYALSGPARAALGWGVIVAKGAAGAIYPIFIFMLLSMNRHLQTLLRRSRIMSKVIDWDHAQIFHVYLSCAGLFFASLHAIGHLSGSFVFASRTSPDAQQAISSYLGVPTPRSYVMYVRSLPGWSGLVSIGLFWAISLLSIPYIRKNHFEVFQLGHLLMFPLFGLLCAHGTAQLLQYPMFGFFLCAPILLMLGERLWRLLRGFRAQDAVAERLDQSTILISARRRDDKDWTYAAGQYVLVQVPAISRFQWHPFTVSGVHGKVLQVHIKADGDWTNRLHEMVSSSDTGRLRVGIDGPFGAPAQQFYDYDYSIIVGSGIGVTPFSAIINDLEDQLLSKDAQDPWGWRRRSRSMSRIRRSLSRAPSRSASRHNARPGSGESSGAEHETKAKHPAPSRRVDFHWVVKDKSDLLWFSDLLNRTMDADTTLAQRGDLDLNIHTHITTKRHNISTHVFRYVLDSYRTDAAPYSALTGLAQPSHFGRPDFPAILAAHLDDLVAAGVRDKKVGVFFCGVPLVGEIISEQCHENNLRARGLGLGVRYEFNMEVFG